MTQSYAHLDDRMLLVGNAAIERRWRLDGGVWRSTSLRDVVRECEWINADDAPPAWRHPELMLHSPPSLHLDGIDGIEVLEPNPGNFTAWLVQRDGGAILAVRFSLWDDLPVILQTVFVVGQNGPWKPADEPELVDRGGVHYRPSPDRLDSFDLRDTTSRWEVTSLYGRSDHRDNLVKTSTGVMFPKETTRQPGHLLQLTSWDGAYGLMAAKLAPPPDEQLHADTGDFALSGPNVSICGSGVRRSDLAEPNGIDAYGTAVGVTNGGRASAAKLFRELIRRLGPPDLPSDGVIYSNNWGGGGGVGVLDQDFVQRELDAAHKLGITHPQIDAGWHSGDARLLGVEQLEPRSTSELSDRFWQVNADRFPDGFAPLGENAKAHHLQLGLWYCLDRADHYGNWSSDLATMLDLWRTCGVTHFKIDGLSLNSRRGERNVRRLLSALSTESGGAVGVTFDVTGSKSRRLGLCHAAAHVTDYFIENRYTRAGTYQPHRTLRTLWRLARYVPTARLLVEWVDTSRHVEAYRDHPLSPAAFGTEYSLAVTLFARPLAWMHLQHLPAEVATQVAEVISAYRPHQREMLAGVVDPIGEEPDGAAWTGFCSQHAPDAGYLMLFREVNDRPTARFELPETVPGPVISLHRIAGQGHQRTIEVGTDHSATFRLPQERSYVLYRWQCDPERQG